jgi:pectate lyase
LADAVSLGSRYIKFAVAGTINLTSPIRVKGSYITIDGSSAPAPGITLKGAGLYIYGNAGAHDVIVRNIRVRDALDDGFGVAYGGYNIVFDHVSAQGSVDGNIDITADSHDVTVSWSIFADPATQKNSLMAYHAQRITMHHNLFIESTDRNPNIAYDYASATGSNVTMDFRNNLVWNWSGGVGARVHYGSKANLVNNYFYAPGGDNEDGLVVCRATAVPATNASDCNYGDATRFARAYVEGNVNPGLTSRNINAVGTESIPFGAAPVTLETACEAAERVRLEAGAMPRDAIDKYYVSTVSVRSDLCPTSLPPSEAETDQGSGTGTTGGDGKFVYVVVYGFNEGSGTTAVDAGGSNFSVTLAGTTWVLPGKLGAAALAFNGTNSKATTALTSHAPQRSYLLWANRQGSGGNGLGRLFDKRTSGGEVEAFYYDSPAGVYRYLRLWSGGTGSWTIPAPSANVWHHLAVVYDASSPSNNPQIYVDGVSQPVTRTRAPSGTPLTNADAYVVGNRGGGDRSWRGLLDEVRIYNRLLTASEIQTDMTTQ